MRVTVEKWLFFPHTRCSFMLPSFPPFLSLCFIRHFLFDDDDDDDFFPQSFLPPLYAHTRDVYWEDNLFARRSSARSALSSRARTLAVYIYARVFARAKRYMYGGKSVWMSSSRQGIMLGWIIPISQCYRECVFTVYNVERTKGSAIGRVEYIRYVYV